MSLPEMWPRDKSDLRIITAAVFIKASYLMCGLQHIFILLFNCEINIAV